MNVLRLEVSIIRTLLKGQRNCSDYGGLNNMYTFSEFSVTQLKVTITHKAFSLILCNQKSD